MDSIQYFSFNEEHVTEEVDFDPEDYNPADLDDVPTEEHGGHDGEAADGGEHHGGHHVANEVLVVLFITMGLLLGGLLREVNKKTKIPYTPMLLVSGMLIGGYREYFGSMSDGTAIV